MMRHNIVGKTRHFGVPFDPILRLDENKNDARIIVLSVDIMRGLGMIGWHHFVKSTNGK